MTFLDKKKPLIFLSVTLVGFTLWLSNDALQNVIDPIAAVFKGREHIIELREDGFYPRELAIKKGDLVIFKTTQSSIFWPASNLHPTHTMYPEFDPKMPIGSEDSWKFQFTIAGQWSYHDHLVPYYTGIVTVFSGEEAQGAYPCDKNEKNDKEFHRCWEEYITSAFEEQGMEAAFETVAYLYSIEPNFASDCHGYVHLLGEEAYRLFSEGKDISLTSKSYYCGYGFYHGFMETLLYTTGDFQKARDFCIYVDKQLFGQSANASQACYHGIGHGAVDGGDRRTWGDPEAMMASGFKLCESVGETRLQRYLCATGIFNAIEILSADSKYKLSSIQKNPFDICHTQSELYREPCYTNMLPAVLKLTKNDIAQAAQYVEIHLIGGEQDAIDNRTVREMVISGLFHEFIRLNLDNDNYITSGIHLCRSLPERSRSSCIEGLAGGHMKYGKPNEEYIKGLAFCGNTLLNNDEQKVCSRYILTHLPIWYPKEKIKEICETTEYKYGEFCLHI